MTFSCLSEAEVRRKYEEAENKKLAIKVIADLTCATKKEVELFLGLRIPPPPKKTEGRKPYNRIDDEEARKLYDAGLNDLSIATKLVVTKAAIGNWRRKQDLPAHTRQKNEIDEERMALYRMGLNDAEIAAAIGLTSKGIHSWRSKHGLPANDTRGGDHRKKG